MGLSWRVTAGTGKVARVASSDLSLGLYVATERRNYKTLSEAQEPRRASASGTSRCVPLELCGADRVYVKSSKRLREEPADYNYSAVRLMCSTDGIALVRVTGEVDFNTAPKILVAVNQALSHGAYRIFIDLAAVSFFGSAGAMVLLVARRRCQSRGAEFVLLRPSRPALRVLAFTDLVRPVIDLRD